MSLAVPPAQPVNIALSSATFELADSTGKAFGAGETQIPVTSAGRQRIRHSAARGDRAGDGEEVR